MPFRSTGSSSPTATASSADSRNDDAIGSSVKVKVDQAPVDRFVGQAAPGQGFDAGVDGLLGAGRIGIDLIDRFDQASENRCHCIRDRSRETRCSQ